MKDLSPEEYADHIGGLITSAIDYSAMADGRLCIRSGSGATYFVTVERMFGWERESTRLDAREGKG